MKGHAYAADGVVGRLGVYARVLLLQGPVGPFFAQLREDLTQQGTEVWKVNLNGGDDLYYYGERLLHFTQPMVAWSDWLRKLLIRTRVEAIVVFGSSRRHHRIAAGIAQELGLDFWAFEEGYLRPDFITLELGGVNADSPLARIPLDTVPLLPAPEGLRQYPGAYWKMARHALRYFAAGWAAAGRYPAYRHHKPFRLRELVCWIRAAYRKPWYRLRERRQVARLLMPGHPRFYLLALQVYNDSQIRSRSPWRRMEDVIEWTVFSFSRFAPSDSLLDIKHHPMDRGHRDYAAAIAAISDRFAVADRVVYVHDPRLPSLLRRSSGVVTVNSTMGVQALHHGVPVMTLGRSFYGHTRMTWQGTLDEFWTFAQPANRLDWIRWKHYVIHQSQVNASFYTGGKTVPNQGMRGIRCAARALVEMTGRLLRASIHGIQRFGAIASRLVTGAEPLPQNPLPRKPFSDYDS